MIPKFAPSPPSIRGAFRNRHSSSRSGEELRHADEDDDDDHQGPLGEGEKIAIGALVLEKVRGRMRTFDLAVIHHKNPLETARLIDAGLAQHLRTGNDGPPRNEAP